jgi:hypothetical protein
MNIPGPTLYKPPGRIEDLQEVREYIFSIDFSALKARMIDEHAPEVDWSRDRLDYVEELYKRWLFLKRKHEFKSLPPSDDIDKFWHCHMLDTRAYLRDTQIIFGYYLHHFPYFGIRSEADKAELLRAWEETQRLNEEEFGEAIYEYDDSEGDAEE